MRYLSARHIAHLCLLFLGIAIGFAFAASYPHRFMDSEASLRSDSCKSTQVAAMPDWGNPQRSQATAPTLSVSASNGISELVAEKSFETAIRLLPKHIVDSAVKQFYPQTQGMASPAIDPHDYLVGLLKIASGSAATTDRDFGNGVHFTANLPTEIMKQGSILPPESEGRSVLPFRLFEGQPIRESSTGGEVTALDQSTTRVYASFNANLGDKFVIAKWSGPGGEIIDFKTYPLNAKSIANYVWLERENWQPGSYRVEYYSPNTLKPVGAGVFKIR